MIKLILDWLNPNPLSMFGFSMVQQKSHSELPLKVVSPGVQSLTEKDTLWDCLVFSGLSSVEGCYLMMGSQRASQALWRWLSPKPLCLQSPFSTKLTRTLCHSTKLKSQERPLYRHRRTLSGWESKYKALYLALKSFFLWSSWSILTAQETFLWNL